MIEEILPRAVAAHDTTADYAGELYAVESAVLGRSVPARRREFITGRVCARTALLRLGLPAAAIPAGARGQPVWPDGIVGSITHCRGYRGAAVARSTDVAAIGIDAEPNERLRSSLVDDIARPEEHGTLARLLASRPDVAWERLLFSIKESIYKACFPATRRALDFADATVALDPAMQQFTAQLLVELAPEHAWLQSLRGRWLVADGLLLSAVVLSPALSGHDRSPAAP